MKQFDRKRPDLKTVTGLFNNDIGAGKPAAFCQFDFRQGGGQRGRLDRPVGKQIKQIGHAPDVILMTMGQNNTANPVSLPV